MRIGVFSTKSYDKIYFEKFLKNDEIGITYFEASLNHHTANMTKGFDAICVFVNDELSKVVLEVLKTNGIKLILLRCAGFNNVDVDFAKQCGIKVYRVPSYSPEAVAEHTLALILTLNRKTHKAYNRVREGNFSLEKLIGFNLFGKTIGVIGTGKIGIVFCKIMLGLGCKVLAYDIKESDELLKLGIVYKNLDELFFHSNIISLHCPLNPTTHHIINKSSYEKMKDGVMIINTSRGGLINTKDTINALKTGKIAYLGIDVYEQEQDLFFKDLSETVIVDDDISRLLSFPNVLITAHQAFLTDEALCQIAETTDANLKSFLRNDYENINAL